jgi:hypothetical protein
LWPLLKKNIMADTTHKSVILLAFANDRDDPVNFLQNLPEEARQIRDSLQRYGRRHLPGVSGSRISRSDRRGPLRYGGQANRYQLLLESPIIRQHGSDVRG